jgi:type I restriction enzyme S subunit
MKNTKPELRFAGFTDDWEQRKLGEILHDLYNGQTPSRFNDEYWNGDINWLASGDLNRFIVDKTTEKITKSGLESANLRIIPKGTFIMAITGLEAAGTRGNCGILGLDTALNQSCMALFPNQKLLDTSFLFQWYRRIGNKYGISFTQGTKQQSYNAELIKILPITLPCVKEQKKIASFFMTLDSAITLHQRKCDALIKVKKSMLQKMFPKNGKSKPEVRFAGFTDDWEQRKLGEFFNETYSPENVSESEL